MITIEEKQALQSNINIITNQIKVLQEYLINKQRELWWLERPHIAEFENDYEMESDDDGGYSNYFEACGIILNHEWIKYNGIEWQTFCDHLDICLYPDEEEVADEHEYYLRDIHNPDDYDIDYPNFVKHAEETMRNPNYAS